MTRKLLGLETKGEAHARAAVAAAAAVDAGG